MDSAATPAPRLAAVLHYIVARTAGAGFGSVKLNKAIVAADREFFRRYGQTITGATSFQKLQFGPVPNGVLVAAQALRAAGSIAEQQVVTPAGIRQEMVALQEPDLAQFSAEEVDVMNLAIAALERVSAGEASEQTHDALWEETRLADQIPVAAAAFPPGTLDPEALAWANS